MLFLLLATLAPWILAQVEEDLSATADQSVTNVQLHHYFETLSSKSVLAVYATIRNNEITWEDLLTRDHPRLPFIKRYFSQLTTRHQLPDTDFILVYHDGCKEKMEPLVFSFSSPKETNTCLIPDFEMFKEIEEHRNNTILRLNSAHPWSKKYAKAFFRGSNTGKFSPEAGPHLNNERMRAILFSENHPDLLDAAFSFLEKETFLPYYQKPLQSAGIPKHLRYKYLLDIDGHTNAYSRCRWILLSNSASVKVQSPFRQWYYKALIPWKHYAPVEEGLGNLEEILYHLKENDALAESIALEGQKLGLELFTQESVDAYVLHLLHTYAKKIVLM